MFKRDRPSYLKIHTRGNNSVTWTCGSRKGQKHLQYLNTSHNMTVKMSASEWPRALAHSWIVALRVNWRCGNGPRKQPRNARAATPPQKKKRTTRLTTSRSETHVTETARVCIGESCLVKQWLKSSSKYCSFLMRTLKNYTIKQLFDDRFMEFHQTDVEVCPDRRWCSVCVLELLQSSTVRVHDSAADTVTSPPALL